MKDLEVEQRPREKLLKHGVRVLTNEELLAILLRTGSKHEDVLKISRRIFKKIETLAGLKRLTLEELLTIPGIKLAKATTILASLELGRRLSQVVFDQQKQFKTLEDVYLLVKEDVESLEQEHLVCLFLDTKLKLIKKETIFIGALNHVTIHPREIFRLALKLSAANIIIIHNHPTGDSEPSENDIKITKQLLAAAQLLGVVLLDHLIIGKNEYYSVNQAKRYYF